jgi:hypothetical protein
MPFGDAILFPASFAGALAGLFGAVYARDAITADVSGFLLLACALIFSALVIRYPLGETEGL